VGISFLFHPCHKSLPAILLYLAKKKNINIYIVHFMNLSLGLISPSLVHIHSYAPSCLPPLICILSLMSETMFYTHKKQAKLLFFNYIFMLCNNKCGDNKYGK
jgi:hypothetical protein